MKMVYKSAQESNVNHYFQDSKLGSLSNQHVKLLPLGKNVSGRYCLWRRLFVWLSVCLSVCPFVVCLLCFVLFFMYGSGSNQG